MARVKTFDYKRIIRSQYLVRFRRKPLDESWLYGFVLACSETLTLLHLLETATFTLNGYSVIRNEDVSLFAVYDRPAYYYESKVLRLKGIRPQPQPEISIGNLSDLLTSIDRLYPLFTIHRELMNDDCCFVGSLAAITAKTFTLDEVDDCGEWIGPRRYRFSDITKIDFGGGYEDALALVARPDRKRKWKSKKTRRN